VERQPLDRPGAAEPGTIDPGLSWSMSQHGQDRIGLRAKGHLRNEGTVTALIRFKCGPDTEVGYVMSRHCLGGPGMCSPFRLLARKAGTLSSPHGA
jgi:hypothetical protein